MKNITSFIINKHLIIGKYVIVLMAIIGISMLFPRNYFNYDFDINKPWKYDNLYAPFSFTINKLADSIEAEKKQVLSNLHPYYSFDENSTQVSTQQFVKALNRHLVLVRKKKKKKNVKLDSAQYVKIAQKLFEDVYRKGILNLADSYEEPLDSTSGIINVLVGDHGNIGSITPIDDLYTQPNACRYIQNQIKIKRDPSLEFLPQLICNSLQANIVYDDKTTSKIIKDRYGEISDTEGYVEQGEVIVAKGAKVTAEAPYKTYQKLLTLEEAYNTQSKEDKNQSFISKHAIDFGYFIITAIILFIFVLFMQSFEKSAYSSLYELTFILVSISLFLYFVKISIDLQSGSLTLLNLYFLPFCIIPIIIKTFFGSRMALYVHIVIVLLSGFLVPLGYEFIFLHFVAGLVAILYNVQTYYWSHFFISTALIFFTYSLGFLGISLVQNGSFDSIQWNVFGWLGINAFLTLLAFPLIPIFEKIFGFLSDITLVELGDLNKPLLKELSKKAPGTFWHSLQVSNLAEAAAMEIKANALLVKVGALYHDIGKIRRPIYFIENQKTAINPHDSLSYLDSAEIIIDHVVHGIVLAKKYKLPNIIIDFIRTHHGTTRTEYFYQMWIKENPKKEVDEKQFRYPGPLPYSRETSIVMMADSIEAASRGLKNPTEEDIHRLVEKIIDGKIQQNQFVNCDLSFKDINQIKKVFKKQLKSLYHIRISYPEEGKLHIPNPKGVD
ncbi:MAG: HD family phosphohydrolase [Chitinophagales bacterium]